MNCFYCHTAIVDGHCVNRCAEKRQEEQNYVDQQYQRKVLEIPEERGIGMVLFILAVEVAFALALVVFFVRGCEHAPAKTFLIDAGSSEATGRASRLTSPRCAHRDFVFVRPSAPRGMVKGGDAPSLRGAERSKLAAVSWLRPHEFNFSNQRRSSPAQHTVAVGPANGLAGPFICPVPCAGRSKARESTTAQEARVTAGAESRSWTLAAGQSI